MNNIDLKTFFEIIAGVVLLANTAYLIRKSRSEKQVKNSSDLISEFQRSLLEQKEKLEEKFERLKERFDALKTGHAMMEYMGASSLAAIWVNNPDGLRMYHNKAYTSLSGFHASDCLGKTGYGIMSTDGFCDAETKKLCKSIAAEWERRDRQVILENRASMQIEKMVHRSDKQTPFLVLTIKAPIVSRGGTVIGVEAMAIKVTEIERVQHEYNT